MDVLRVAMHPQRLGQSLEHVFPVIIIREVLERRDNTAGGGGARRMLYHFIENKIKKSDNNALLSITSD
jgi:hypothetical protein